MRVCRRKKGKNWNFYGVRFSHPLYLKARKALKMEGCEHLSFYQFKKVIKKVINNVLIAFFDTLKDTYGTKKVIFI